MTKTASTALFLVACGTGTSRAPAPAPGETSVPEATNESTGSREALAAPPAEFAAGLPRPTLPAKFVGNVTTSNRVPPDFANYWNQLTPENEGKWANVEPTRDTMNWSALDADYAYSKQHGIPFKEHTFVWGAQEPSWIDALSPSEQAAEVEEWIRSFCDRYPDVPMIDVVNEPEHRPPSYLNAIGGAGASGFDWVIWAFRKARVYCPRSVLILNDYNVLRNETDRFVTIANVVKGSGCLDAVGAQAHGLESEPLTEMKANLEKVASIGVPIYVTEYDVDVADDQEQRRIVEQQMSVFWSSPLVAGITLWGYVYGSTWRPNAGLVKDGAPRPAMSWLTHFLGRDGAGAAR